MAWASLSFPGAGGVQPDVPAVDPCLVWAWATGWRDLSAPNAAVPAVVPVLAELVGTVGQWRGELATHAGCNISALYPDTAAYCTANLTLAYLQQWARSTAGQSVLARLELQLPVLPGRNVPASQPAAAAVAAGLAAAPARPESSTPVLLGVVDHGCPFAHQGLRAPDGSSRLLAVWDQGGGPGPGHPPAGAGYGRELQRAALSALLLAHRLPNGQVNEDACYRAAAWPGLAARLSHGAAVLDLAAGPLPYARRSSSTPNTSPPPWRAGWAGDAAHGNTDIVFVQLPRPAVQDSSSASLPRHLLDGLRYILQCTGPRTRHVVVNASDGTSRGGHDGHSIAERAMVALQQEAAQAADVPRTLHIVLPAGNAHEQARHAQWTLAAPGPVAPLTLWLPPGSEAPAWCFVQVPLAAADALQVQLVAPDGQASGWVAAGQARGLAGANGAAPVAGVVFPFARALPGEPDDGRQGCVPVLLALAATGGFNSDKAMAGAWRLEMRLQRALAEAVDVHAYCCRNQTNLGALARAQQARFTDPAHDAQRWRRAQRDDPAAPSSPIRMRGSLNGLATSSSLTVVGGVRMRDGQPACYTATGADRPLGAARDRPDVSAPTDESAALDGLHVGGNRSGAVVRVQGTSFAAPQAARVLVNAMAAYAAAASRGTAPTVAQQPAADARRNGPTVVGRR